MRLDPKNWQQDIDTTIPVDVEELQLFLKPLAIQGV